MKYWVYITLPQASELVYSILLFDVFWMHHYFYSRCSFDPTLDARLNRNNSALRINAAARHSWKSLSFPASYGRYAICELVWNFNPAKLLRIHVSEKFNIIIECDGGVGNSAQWKKFHRRRADSSVTCARILKCYKLLNDWI